MRGDLFCLLLALTLLGSSPLSAHAQSASVTGRVADPTGAVVRNVEITLTNLNTPFVRRTRTNNAGTYIMQNVPAGTYSLRAAMDGFKPYTQTDIIVSASQDLVLDIRIEVGQAIQSVTVYDNSARTTEGTGSYTTKETSAATNIAMSPREIPQSVTVITRQRMDDQQLNSVQQVLENTTGVSSSVTDSERVSFFSRGMEITNFQYDGIPTADVPNIFVPSDSLLDTVAYDRVEIVRGSTGLLSGWGNPSASVNLIRKHPFHNFAASGSALGGSWDNYRGTLDISTPITPGGRVRARVAGAYQQQHSFINFYKQRRGTVYGIVDADLTHSTTLSVGYEYEDVDPRGSMWGGLPIFFMDNTARIGRCRIILEPVGTSGITGCRQHSPGLRAT